MSKRLLKIIDFLVCPYCRGALVRRDNHLVCRYHHMGFLIRDSCVDFTWEHARRGELKDFEEASSSDINTQNIPTDTAGSAKGA